MFKKDRQGNFLDFQGRPVSQVNAQTMMAAVKAPEQIKETYRTSPAKKTDGPQRADMPVHLLDIHMEKGMHCIDCHFVQDAHGNTKLYRKSAPPSKSSASIATAPSANMPP